MGLGLHLYLYDLEKNRPVDREHAHQRMSNHAFMSYLYDRSEWITRMFTCEITPGGGTLDEDHSLGEGEDELFGRDDLERFLAELRGVPRPDAEDVFLAWSYDHLLLLVTTALSRPHLTLSLAVL